LRSKQDFNGSISIEGPVYSETPSATHIEGPKAFGNGSISIEGPVYSETPSATHIEGLKAFGNGNIST
jgi:hypothetical protein